MTKKKKQRVSGAKNPNFNNRSKNERRNKPGAVESGNRIAVLSGVAEELEKVISSDNTGRNNVFESTHGPRKGKKRNTFVFCNQSENEKLSLGDRFEIFSSVTLIKQSKT